MSKEKKIIVPPMPEDIQQAIDAERRHPSPPREVLERVRSRLHLSLGLGAPGFADPSASPVPPPASTRAPLLKPMLVVLGTIVVAGGVTTYAIMKKSRPPQIKQAIHSPDNSARTQTAISTLKAEQKILDRARAALLSKRLSRARQALSEHLRRFPEGHLAEERDALSIITLVHSGRLQEARAQADRFRQHYPRSLQQPAIDTAIGNKP